MGAKRQPSYRIVVAESRSPRDGRFLETVGIYNPKTQPMTLRIDAERAKYWIDHGAQPTDTVRALLVRVGALEGRTSQKGLAEGYVTEPPHAASRSSSCPPTAVPRSKRTERPEHARRPRRWLPRIAVASMLWSGDSRASGRKFVDRA